MPDQQKSVTRREWFVRLGRRTILGGISAVSLIFVARRVNGECVNTDSTCSACWLWEQCQLPQAKETRQVMEGNNHE